MNVSRQYRFIFLSNVKCGSTSISRSLAKLSEPDLTEGIPRHTRARLLRPMLAERGVNWDDMFVFTSIRNPWDRLVSEWYYAMKTPTAKLRDDAMAADSFRAFLASEGVEDRCRNHSNFVSFACDEDGAPLVDYALRMEDIDRNLPTVLDMLSVTTKIEVNRLNATRPPTSDYRSHYEETTRRLAESLLREDVVVGGYRF